MKTKLIQIGDSRGIRIPQSLIERAGLETEVNLRATESGILIETARARRAGWAEAAQQLRERDESGLLDEPTPTDFDESEWQWQ